MSTPMKHTKKNDDHRSVVMIGDTAVGGQSVPVIAGPCAVESYEQLKHVAETLVQSGVKCIRGGAFKPRTSPYSFQGMGMEGLMLLDQIRKEYNLAAVTEVMSVEQIGMAQDYVDCLQVGARNMQNFDLLKALGQQRKPVLLKRGLTATLQEFLMAAEYILAGGNNDVILCERGIRSFDTETRNVLDVGAIARLKEMTHLPVIGDPSHATGKRSLVAPAAKACVAVGADAIIVEAHPVPHESVSDADQALCLDELSQLVSDLHLVATAVGRPSTATERMDEAKRPLERRLRVAV
ncbi:MAG: bifunctional 3-deoxy-7-phosphoheptulonate synthase/chorismate mutase [Candidatus Melainabacteria bacterium]